MPSGRTDATLYIGAQGGIEQMNVSTLYKPGELGKRIELNGKAYQLVQLDSGATASTSAGAPVAGHVVFWKSRANYLVTNDKAQAETPGNAAGASAAAGVLCSTKTSGQAGGDATITAGNYGYIQQRGNHVGVASGAITAAAGDTLVANSAVATATIAKYTPGTAPAVNPVVGTATAATASNYTAARLGGSDLVDVP